MKLQDIIDSPCVSGSDKFHDRYSIAQLVDAHNIGAAPLTKLTAALDSCRVAAKIAEECGYEENAKAIRATVAFIESVMS